MYSVTFQTYLSRKNEKDFVPIKCWQKLSNFVNYNASKFVLDEKKKTLGQLDARLTCSLRKIHKMTPLVINSFRMLPCNAKMIELRLFY